MFSWEREDLRCCKDSIERCFDEIRDWSRSISDFFEDVWGNVGFGMGLEGGIDKGLEPPADKSRDEPGIEAI